MDDLIRVYSITAATLIIAAGTAQLYRWKTFPSQERLHWQATAALNLSALWGTWESLNAGYPGGFRVYLIAMALTWLLAAVMHHPLTAWRHRRATPKE